MSSQFDCLNLCRLCLMKDRVQVPIFEDAGEVNQIFLKIHACLPIKLSRDDKLPKKICDDCLCKVELFYQFWNTAVDSEKQLLQWLGMEEMEDKQQGYVTEVLDPNVMKHEGSSDNRLDGNVLQVGGHQNMDLNMINNISIITMPAANEQSFSTVPMGADGTVHIAGPSTSVVHNQAGVAHLQEVDVHHEDVDNIDDGCDNDNGLTVKGEIGEDDRSMEQTYVTLSCDEAGPSGLQQQKLSDISEIAIQQSTDGEHKTGSSEEPINTTSINHNLGSAKSSNRGIFVIERESLVMRKWQILEFNGKPYYAFVPEDEIPIKEEDIPEYPDASNVVVEEEQEHQEQERAQVREEEEEGEEGGEDEEEEDQEHMNYSKEIATMEPDTEEYMDEEWLDEPLQSNDSVDVKSVVTNGKVQAPPAVADLYQVKVEAGVVLLEKLNMETVQPVEQRAGIAYKRVNIVDKDDRAMDIGANDYDDNGDVDDDDDDVIEDNEDDDDDEHDEEVGFVETSIENSRKALKCKICSETFETNLAFRKHVAWTHKKKICIQENGAYICSVCDYRTLKKSQFAAHLQRKHETWSRRRQGGAVATFPCQACNFVCRSKHSLQSHFIRKHTDRYEHQCTFCEKKFKIKGDLTNHVRFHHKEKPVNCDVCGKQCLNSGSLYVHQKWAHYKPKYECNICKRRMVTQENLDQHMVMQHEKREKIVCAECGKTFTKKDSFKRHMAVHTGAKPYSCVICNKPFARRSQLRQHLLIHTGKRPFVCDICGKAFTQKPGLICHRKTHPGKHPPLPVMPIGDIVKEFTENYLAEYAPGKKQEGLEDDADDVETEEDEDYYEEEELIDDDVQHGGQQVLLDE